MHSTKKKVVITAFTAAVLAAAAALGVIISSGAGKPDTYKNNVYTNAFNELASDISGLSDSLRKASYASTPSAISSICSEAYAEASAASAALGALPYSNMELEKTASFLSRAGDYSSFLLRRASSGGGLDDGERENVVSLADTAEILSDEFLRLNSYLISGELSADSLEFSRDALDSIDETVNDPGFAASFKRLEAQFPELPELIYDGQFSDHVAKLTPRLLENRDDVSESRAIERASDFTGLMEGVFSSEGLREGTAPVYVISANTRRGPMTLEVTRAGGFVVYYENSRTVGEGRVSPEDAEELACDFIKKQCFTDMEAVFRNATESRLDITFAFSKSGTVYYTDVIKVSVALDNGEIIGFDAAGYVASHAKRAETAPALSEAEAEKLISPQLTVFSHSLAVIPTRGKYEVLCHEYRCMDSEDRECIIYINAETGAEEAICLVNGDSDGSVKY